jgi:hypothetical protein
MSTPFEGFWIPQKIRPIIITPQIQWRTIPFKERYPTRSVKEPVDVLWPRLTLHEWSNLLDLLSKSRKPVPQNFFGRMQNALRVISQRFQNSRDPLTVRAMNSVPAWTGFSPEMIRFTLGSLDLMPVDSLQKIVNLTLPNTVRSQFINLLDSCDLDGRIRFFGKGIPNRIKSLFPGDQTYPVNLKYPDMVLGFAAGNVIGTSHLIALLGQISALIGPGSDNDERLFPSILVKNSRDEPIFTPLLLSAIEQIDPSLVESIAVMVWDYEDIKLQEYLISNANLVIAAASDFTIAAIDRVIENVKTTSKPIRFHRHGHKVSFSTISSSYLTKKKAPWITDKLDFIHLTTFLSAIDSIYWNQQGCLSSRIHFVERYELNNPQIYGMELAEKIRVLRTFLPRGNLPLHNLHNKYEKYTALTKTGKVKLCSNYEDDFLVVTDDRSWTPTLFKEAINDCSERTIIVRPINDVAQVPNKYLKWLPKANLQAMSVAIDGPEWSTWSDRFSKFVSAISARGITSIRTIGRGPFPQLAYSWDGYLPIDLSAERDAGYFSTVEFENTYQQITDTYRFYTSRNLIM